MIIGGSVFAALAAPVVAVVILLVAYGIATRGRGETARLARREERGVTEVVGVILLFGLVLAGASVVFLTGTQANESAQERNRLESAEVSMKAIDSQFGSLSGSDDDTILRSPSFPERESGRVSVNETETTVTFALNGTAACSASVDLGSIRYTDDGGDWVAYEGGGVWRNSGNHTEVVSPPDLTYENVSEDNGTVNFVASNVSGSANTTMDLEATRNRTGSNDQTQVFTRNLLVHDGSGDLCAPRENLTITVESPYYEAWRDYFVDEFPDSVRADGDLSVDHGTGTVTMVLDEDELEPFDSDGDGTPDFDDNCPATYNPNQRNTDATGGGDVCDPDDDDPVNGANPAEPPDGSDNCAKYFNPAQDDQDGDGIGDACDPDVDGDGYREADLLPEPYELMVNNDTFVGGGTPDNCPNTYNPNQTNTDQVNPNPASVPDGDGLGDACDPDIDDGQNTGVPEKRNPNDNCPTIYNESQANLDGGKRGDPCDPDDDGDDYYDSVDSEYESPDGTPGIDTSRWLGSDNCPDHYNPDQNDTDGNTLGDACDGDDDGDTVPDGIDNCPKIRNRPQANTEVDKYGMSEGRNERGNACDPDDDGDNWYDTVEPGYRSPDGTPGIDTGRFAGKDNCPHTYNPPQKDLDGDGVGAACDPDAGSGATGTPPPYDDTFVDIQNVDGAAYRQVAIYASVDTPAGKNGALHEGDFRVYEDGIKRPIVDVRFTEDTRVDIVFVFDDTGSMREEITDMQANTNQFANQLEAAGIDARYALVSFKDGYTVDQPLTSNVGQFQASVNAMHASGGGDGPEDSFDAIHRGTQLNFRPTAQKVVVHVTDAPSHTDTRSTYSHEAVKRVIADEGMSFYSASPPHGCMAAGTTCYPWSTGSWQYREIATDTGGRWLDMTRVTGFEPFLNEILNDLTSRYRVIFETCRPGDGTHRDVHLYADSGGAVGRDGTRYVAPADGTPDHCYSPPPANPTPDRPGPDLGVDPPVADDRPLVTFPTCEKADTPSFGPGIPADPADVADDGPVDGTRGCYPTKPAGFGPGTPPEPYTTVVTVRVNLVEVDSTGR